MNDKAGLNILDFLASGISKEDPVIKAVFSDENGIGAIANELEEVKEFIDYYSGTDDIKNHTGRTLEIILDLFLKMSRRLKENDNDYLRRAMALLYRKGDIIWGDKLNIKNILEEYFKNIKCYFAENTNEINFINDEDFIYDNTWELEGGALLDFEARFSGKHGLLFNGTEGESCSQKILRDFNETNYVFHFMLKGKCGVIIKREDGKYWNANDQLFSGPTVLEWVDEEYINYFDNSEWENASCFIVLTEPTDSLTIKFVCKENEKAYIDHVRLYIKPYNPSYAIIIQFSGYKITEDTLHLGKDGNEPIPDVNYVDESYYDRSYIIGPEAISQKNIVFSLIEKIRPCGIRYFMEFLEKAETEG